MFKKLLSWFTPLGLAAVALTMAIGLYLSCVTGIQLLYWRWMMDDNEVCQYVPQCKGAAVTPVLNVATKTGAWRVEVTSSASNTAIRDGLTQWITQSGARHFATDVNMVRTATPLRGAY